MPGHLLLTFLLAALLGAIPVGVIVARHLGQPDPRHAGSGNPGATNVLRTGGKLAGALTLAGDILKGIVAVGVVPGLVAAPAGALVPPALAAIAAVLGHMFSPFTGFRGGKGVATGLGVFAMLMPGPTAGAVLVFTGAVGVTRYVSVGSILGAVTVPLAGAWAGYPSETAGSAALIALLVIWRHRDNIRRLSKGQENRLGKQKGQKSLGVENPRGSQPRP